MWLYDARVRPRVAIVAAGLLLLIQGLSEAFPSRAGGDSELAILDAGIERSEDAPFVPSDFEFLPGDPLYFVFHVAGFKIKADETTPVKSISLSYEISLEDLNGVPLTESVDGRITAELGPEDKNWTPKRRASFLLPSFPAAGDFRLHLKVKDLFANTETTRDFPFKIGGVHIQEAREITVQNFAFLRKEDDAKELEIAAYSPGDSVFARFDMVGFALGPGNKYKLSYALKVLRPDGKPFLQESEPQRFADSSFYPARFVPGRIEITTPANAMRGQYVVTISIRDLIGNHSCELTRSFSIE